MDRESHPRRKSSLSPGQLFLRMMLREGMNTGWQGGRRLYAMPTFCGSAMQVILHRER
jgi:hypothetical protein